MVSNNISHRLTKGELREKFIRRVVQDEFPNLLLKSGILCEGTWQSTQGDFLWLRDGARIGNLDLYDLKDCLMFMEIKSQATAKELRAINDMQLFISGDMACSNIRFKKTKRMDLVNIYR